MVMVPKKLYSFTTRNYYLESQNGLAFRYIRYHHVKLRPVDTEALDDAVLVAEVAVDPVEGDDHDDGENDCKARQILHF